MLTFILHVAGQVGHVAGLGSHGMDRNTLSIPVYL
jgi:hypothetical protein